MPLPVLSNSLAISADDLLRHAIQVEQRWSEHLADPVLLDVGPVFANPALPSVAEANCVFAVSAAGADPASWIGEVDRAFTAAGGRCRRWSQGTATLQPLLESAGFRPTAQTVLQLRRASAEPGADFAGIKIIPARAALAAYGGFVERACGAASPPATQAAEAALLHLDDGHYDVLVALSGAEVIASIGVFSMGQVGAIRELRVAAAHQRQGLGRLLLNRALESCGRSLFRHVIAAVPSSAVAAEQLFRRSGFFPVGVLRHLERD